MIARLWWKETRILWPAWPVLFGSGAGLQWILLASGAEDVRSGILMPIALCWTTLYAFVAASAAFAGERETGTLGLLDALPVDRKILWLGKATFVLVSTLGLALLMLSLGYVGSTRMLWGDPGKTDFIGQFSTLLFEAMAWGLLWSALLRNPMVAGALALISVGAVWYFASEKVEMAYVADSEIVTRLFMAALALTASAVAIIGRPLEGWSSPRFLGTDADDTQADHATPIRPRPASPARVLIRKTKHESFPMWLGATIAGWGALAWLLYLHNGVTDTGVPALLGFGAALMAGVGVFGNETAVGSQQFLLHLGAGPGPIWSRTLRTWGNGLAVTGFVILAMLSVRWPGWWNLQVLRWLAAQPYADSPFPFVAVFADAFTIGLLAGMVFRRRITAGMIAVLAWLLVVPLQLGLAGMGLVAPWTLLLTPVVLMGISRAWAGDWLDARPGAARWLRLAGYVAVPSVVLSAAFIANRAWGVPDPGPVLVSASDIGPTAPDTAATTPHHRFPADIQSMGGMLGPPGMQEPMTLTGTWESLFAQHRRARQLTGSAPNAQAMEYALAIDTQATMQALDWAALDNQTPELLRKALADLRTLPPFPTLGEVMKAEAPIVERTLALPGAELAVRLNGPSRQSTSTRVVEAMLLYPPWERERARRVCRTEFKRLIAESKIESEPLPDRKFFQRMEEIRRISPLAARIMVYGWLPEQLRGALAGRRGLAQVIALRAWNLDHDKAYPESLDALVPDLFDRLPLDPYSARTFGYIRSQGQKVARLDLRFQPVGDSRETKPGQWLLFSVGPDRRERSSTSELGPNAQGLPVGALVFPLP